MFHEMDLKPMPEVDAQQPVRLSEGPNSSERIHRISLSTDSMVTVRLSDTTLFSTADTLHDGEVLEKSNGPKLMANGDEVVQLPGECDNIVAIEGGDMVLEQELNQMPEADRQSTASSLSNTESKRAENKSTAFRSRSNSAGTLSSLGSTHVDWDELDKSEEQAPRDEGSDEVCCNQDL